MCSAPILSVARHGLSKRPVAALLAGVAGAVLAVAALPSTAAVVESGQPGFAGPAALPHFAVNSAPSAATPEWLDLSTGSGYVDLWFQVHEPETGALRDGSRPVSGLAGLSLPHAATKPGAGSASEVAALTGHLPWVRHADSVGRLAGGDDTDGEPAAGTASDPPVERVRWEAIQATNWAAVADKAEPHGRAANDPALWPLLQGIEWLRKQRWQVLGALAGIVVAAGLLKVYSRRPGN